MRSFRFLNRFRRPGSLVRPGMTIKERLLYVADIIEAENGRFDMRTFCDGPNGKVDSYDRLAQGDAPEDFPCGTTFCMAGWAVAVTPRSEIKTPFTATPGNSASYLEKAGSELLGMPTGFFYDSTLDADGAVTLLRDRAEKL